MAKSSSDDPIDILALAAHRDDVEQTCGGTLLKMAEHGYRTGILDLTQGEMGTRGNAEDRAHEATEAARILKVSWRHALDIPDGRVENTWENRLKVARVIREQRPRVVILPYWQGRHPDHYTASALGYEACFLAGLAKLDVGRALSAQQSVVSAQLNAEIDQALQKALDDLRGKGTGEGLSDRSRTEAGSSPSEQEPERDVKGRGASGADEIAKEAGGRGFSLAAGGAQESGASAPEALGPHRPFKIIYASLYHDVRPTFVVDITDQFEARIESLMAYKSQYSDQQTGQGLFPAQADIRARVEAMARFYGMMGGVTYAEPFVQKEVGLVDDLLAIPVKSI